MNKLPEMGNKGEYTQESSDFSDPYNSEIFPRPKPGYELSSLIIGNKGEKQNWPIDHAVKKGVSHLRTAMRVRIQNLKLNPDRTARTAKIALAEETRQRTMQQPLIKPGMLDVAWGK